MKKGQSRRDVLLGGAAGVVAASIAGGQRADAQQASPGAGGKALPRPDPTFKGTIGPTIETSKPDYPLPARAPKGAPNVLVVLLDDVGFGMTSEFGGPAQTPNMEKLAKGGLAYVRFHTTALCSPTRAALLTGRNHHSVGTGVIIQKPVTATAALLLRSAFGRDEHRRWPGNRQAPQRWDWRSRRSRGGTSASWPASGTVTQCAETRPRLGHAGLFRPRVRARPRPSGRGAHERATMYSGRHSPQGCAAKELGYSP
jgi:Sulfatase